MVDYDARDLQKLVDRMGGQPPSEELLEALLAHARETEDPVLRGLVSHYLLISRLALELLERQERLHQAAGQPPDELLRLARLVLRPPTPGTGNGTT
jgi:hypothetical protein